MYYRRTLIDRWQDLLDLSGDSQRFYFYAFAGPLSSPYGITLLHKGQARRDLGLTRVSLEAVLVELVAAGVVVCDDLGSRIVIADLELARVIRPKRPNNHRAMLKALLNIPPCETYTQTSKQWKWQGSQVPEITGAAAPHVGHTSPTRGPLVAHKKEKEKENKKEIKKEKRRKRFVPPTESEVSAHMHNKGLPLADADEQGQEFVLFYSSKGWLVGKSKMQNWRAAATRWVNRHKGPKPAQQDADQLFDRMSKYYE